MGNSKQVVKKDYMQIAKGAFNETLKVPEVKDLILSIPGPRNMP